MKRIITTLYVAAAMFACAGEPQLDVQAFALKDGREVALTPSGEGVFQTVAPSVRLIITVRDPLPWEEPAVTVATTSALDRNVLMATKAESGRSVRAQLLDAEVSLASASIGPAELTLEAEHRCCTGSMWRVDVAALGAEQSVFVWAHDAPGDTLEGD